jgi:hypothetical protein
VHFHSYNLAVLGWMKVPIIDNRSFSAIHFSISLSDLKKTIGPSDPVGRTSANLTKIGANLQLLVHALCFPQSYSTVSTSPSSSQPGGPPCWASPLAVGLIASLATPTMQCNFEGSNLENLSLYNFFLQCEKNQSR